MTSTVEGGVFLAAILMTAYLAADPIRFRLRRRWEREHVGHIAADEPETLPGPRRGPIARRLKAAGLSGPPEAYLFAVSVLSGISSLVFLRLLPAFPPAALIAGVLALYLPWALLNELVRQRARRLEHQLIDAIDLTAGTLQAGGNLPQALRGAASASRQPLRGELEQALQGMAVGMPIDRAFGGIADRYASEAARIFAITLAAKIRVGGDLVPMLRSLSETLRDSWRQQRQVRAQLAGARLTAIGVVALPYVLAVVLVWLQPGWFTTLFNNNVGTTLLFLAVVMQIGGIVWLWRILAREL
jgi:tight adherence protein B